MSEPTDKGLTTAQAADLMIDLWRIARRAKRDKGTPAGVLIACERAMERFNDFGFRCNEMIDEPYHDGMQAQVIDDEGGTENRRVKDCLSPAIYANDRLVRQAQIVVTGK